MATLVGFEESTFDPERYKREVCDNHGNPLTTDGVLEGLASVSRDYDSAPAQHWLTAMKDTPFYISRRDA